MKTGLTIKEMAQELLRQSKAKQDYLVNTGSLSLSVTSDAPQLRVTENGLDKITPLDIRQTAHRQLGTYLGIPQKYYELMRTDAPELLAYNANYWFSQKNELRTLRTMDGCARAFLSNRYTNPSDTGERTDPHGRKCAASQSRRFSIRWRPLLSGTACSLEIGGPQTRLRTSVPDMHIRSVSAGTPLFSLSP